MTMVNVPERVSGIVTDDSIPLKGSEKTTVPSSHCNSMMIILYLSHFAMSLAGIVYYLPCPLISVIYSGEEYALRVVFCHYIDERTISKELTRAKYIRTAAKA